MNLSARTYMPSHKHTSTSPLQNKFLRKDSLNSPNRKTLTATQSALKKTRQTPNRVISPQFTLSRSKPSRPQETYALYPSITHSKRSSPPLKTKIIIINRKKYYKILLPSKEPTRTTSKQPLKSDIAFKDLYKQLSSMSISSNVTSYISTF